VVAGGDQRSHLHRAHLFDDAVGGGNVWSPIERGGVQPVGDRSEGGQLPVAEVACENQRRLAVEPQLRKQLMGAWLNFDAAILGMRRIVLPDVIEMGEFGAEATEI